LCALVLRECASSVSNIFQRSLARGSACSMQYWECVALARCIADEPGSRASKMDWRLPVHLIALLSCQSSIFRSEGLGNGVPLKANRGPSSSVCRAYSKVPRRWWSYMSNHLQQLSSTLSLKSPPRHVHRLFAPKRTTLPAAAGLR
jgi:hypothetical protein